MNATRTTISGVMALTLFLSCGMACAEDVISKPATSLQVSALDTLGQLDPAWTDKLLTWDRSAEQGALSPKLKSMIRMVLNLSVTHINRPNTERYMSEALANGATKAELLSVIKLTAVLGVHSYALSAPVIRDVLVEKGVKIAPRTQGSTPTIDAMHKAGNLNANWKEIEEWDPVWLENYLRMATSIWTDRVLDAKTIELLCIAGDASVTHLWAPGVRRHAEAALQFGASPDEIFEVLRIVSGQGMESVELAVPLLELLSLGKP